MGNDNSFLGGIIHGVEHGFDDTAMLLRGDSAASAPAISSRPPAYAPPSKWYPPARDLDDGSYVYYTVHTDVLRTIADTISGEVPALRQEISGLRSFVSAGTLTSALGNVANPAMPANWPTGTDLGAKMQSAAEGFAAAAGQVADIHSAAVRKLAATASTYAEAENTNYRQVRAGAGTLQVMPGKSDPRTESVPLTARQIDIKPSPALAGTDVASMYYDDVMNLLHGIRPEAYSEFGNCLRSMGAALDQAAARIVTSVNELARDWDGASAAKAFEAFEIIHDQTATLAAQATQAGKVAAWLGDEVLPGYKAIPEPRVALSNGAGNDPGYRQLVIDVQGYLENLNCLLRDAYDAVPSPLVGTSGTAGHAGQPPAHVPDPNPFGSNQR